MVRLFAIATVVIGSFVGPVWAQDTAPYASARPFGTLRQQADVQQAWLKERLEVNLPKVMRDHEIDMWVVSMREYNEDPVFRALVSPTAFAARRRRRRVPTSRRNSGAARSGICWPTSYASAIPERLP